MGNILSQAIKQREQQLDTASDGADGGARTSGIETSPQLRVILTGRLRNVPSVVIPLLFENGQWFIKLHEPKAQEKEWKYWFLDTGATACVVHKDVCPLDAPEITVQTDILTRQQRTELPQVCLFSPALKHVDAKPSSSYCIQDVRSICMDHLISIPRSMVAKGRFGGICGLSFFHHHTMVLDGPRNRLHLLQRPENADSKIGRFGRHVSTSGHYHMPILEAVLGLLDARGTFEPLTQVRLGIDTGSNMSSLSPTVVKANTRLGALFNKRNKASTATGGFTVLTSERIYLRIGSKIWRVPFFTPENPKSQWNQENDGLLGTQILQHLKLEWSAVSGQAHVL